MVYSASQRDSSTPALIAYIALPSTSWADVLERVMLNDKRTSIFSLDLPIGVAGKCSTSRAEFVTNTELAKILVQNIGDAKTFSVTDDHRCASVL